MIQDFLLEIGCEELPVSAQIQFINILSQSISQAFFNAHITFNDIKTFATPRRLAVWVRGVSEKQPPIEIERQGPNFEQAYDKNGSPTLACFGFAKSCDTSIDQLALKETPKGRRVVFISKKPGKNTVDLLPEIISAAIQALPIPKSMRWNNHDISFIRPVHWVMMLFGETLIPVNILGKNTMHSTRGHRFHHPKEIRISKPEDYNMLLYSQGFVIADFETRKKYIEKSIQKSVGENNHALIHADLLNEVTALVEWPVTLRGSFDQRFLSMPKEVLIASIETHQKCFVVENHRRELQPYFILVSNIDSKNKEAVIRGNERVIRARLSDAEFFYHQDIKQKLIDRLAQLDHVMFQDKLGSLGEKTERLIKLSAHIAKKIGVDVNIVKRAASLCKCDLVTSMVNEFPALQGVAGYYYALQDEEPTSCALAIREHYLPKFSKDDLPHSLEGCSLALADRLDTLVGMFGIHEVPTGEKDPSGLRRAALGVLRILIEKSLSIDLRLLLKEAGGLYELTFPDSSLDRLFDFMMVRLKSYYTENNVSPEIVESVLTCQPNAPLDFDRRLRAVLQFQSLPESGSLSAANKRVSNILKKESKHIRTKKINPALFESEIEKNLFQVLTECAKNVDILLQDSNYKQALSELSVLKSPIDQFFNEVMIMVKNEKVRQNRLAILATIRELFVKVADISVL